MKLGFIGVSIAVAATNVAKAQAPSIDVPEAGARVRISRTGAPTLTGTVLARTADSIVVGRTDDVRETVAMKDVTGLAISRGRTRNVVVATTMGLVAGAVGGWQLKKHGDRVTTTEAIFKSTDPSNLYLQGAPAADTTVGNRMWIPFGMLVGSSAGTLVGYMWKERWRPAAIRRGDARVGFIPEAQSRRVALAISARF